MANKATSGSKCKLYYGDSAADTLLAGVLEITPPKATVDKIDVSTMDSPEDANGIQYQEKDPGWADVDDVEATLKWTPALRTTLAGQLGVKQNFKVEYSDGSAHEWFGFISELGDKTERQGVIAVEVKIAVDGPVTFTAAA